MTEIASINNGLNAAGVRAPLYWFHDKGFFEEFLGDKKDLWDHPTGIKLDDEIILEKVAVNLGELHQVEISGSIINEGLSK